MDFCYVSDRPNEVQKYFNKKDEILDLLHFQFINFFSFSEVESRLMIPITSHRDMQNFALLIEVRLPTSLPQNQLLTFC
jgi:hypothetical protein